jgi:hypothetical protein
MQDKSRVNSRAEARESHDSGKSAFGVKDTPSRKGTSANPPVPSTATKPAQAYPEQLVSTLPQTCEPTTPLTGQSPNSKSGRSQTTRAAMQAELDRLTQKVDLHKQQLAVLEVDDYTEAPADENEGTNERSMHLDIKKEPGTDSPPKNDVQWKGPEDEPEYAELPASSHCQTPVRSQVEGALPPQIHSRASTKELKRLQWLEETIDCVMEVWQPQIQDK